MALGVKRKRNEHNEVTTKLKKSTQIKEIPKQPVEQVKRLETLISESNKHLNHLRTLLDLAENNDDRELATRAAIACCRVFCRLIARKTFKLEKSDHVNPILDGWLEARYEEFISLLTSLVESENNATQRVAITLLMRLVKIEAQQCQTRILSKRGLLMRLIQSLLINEKAETARSTFTKEYLKLHQDTTTYFCRIFM